MDDSICRTEFDSAPDFRQVVEEPAQLLDVALPAYQADGSADQTSQLLQHETLSVILADRLRCAAAIVRLVVRPPVAALPRLNVVRGRV
jgi:hypothetical protein